MSLRVQTICHDTTLTGYGVWSEGLATDGLVFEMGGELVEELCGPAWNCAGGKRGPRS